MSTRGECRKRRGSRWKKERISNKEMNNDNIFEFQKTYFSKLFKSLMIIVAEETFYSSIRNL